MKNVDASEKICRFCEHAATGGEEYPETVTCRKKNKEMPCDGICRSFSYDILKKPVQPLPDIPGLDPSVLED